MPEFFREWLETLTDEQLEELSEYLDAYIEDGYDVDTDVLGLEGEEDEV